MVAVEVITGAWKTPMVCPVVGWIHTQLIMDPRMLATEPKEVPPIGLLEEMMPGIKLTSPWMTFNLSLFCFDSQLVFDRVLCYTVEVYVLFLQMTSLKTK